MCYTLSIYIDMKKCKHCGFDTHIRNPSGFCDHLYYPEYCDVCRKDHIDPSDKLVPLSGSGTCIAELQSKINELVKEVNKLKSEMNTTIGGGH